MGMSISLKKDTGKTNINHNNRELGERDRERNGHIDFSRSDKNKYLVKQDIKQLYQQEFGEALEKYNAKQKRKDRKIPDYYKHIQKGKKTSPQQEMIIQIGDKDDFGDNEATKDMANDVLNEWFEDFQERNPQLKIYNAAIHNDEATPHMHLNFVPVAEGYKKGLERQVAFDRAIKQQDDTLDKVRPFDDWREKEIKLLEEKINERGIERELVGTNQYEDVTEYKEKQHELEAIQEKINHAKSDLSHVQAFDHDLMGIDAKSEEKRSIGSKFGLKGKESIVMPKENYEKLYALASKSVEHAESAKKYKAEKDQMKEELEKVVPAAKKIQEENKNLTQKNKVLVKENMILHEAFDVLKDKFKEHKQQFSKMIGHAKAKAINALGYKKYPQKVFDEKNQHEQEGIKEFAQERKKQQKTKTKDDGLEL